MARSFIVLCAHATAGGDFLLDDVPGTSGRLDAALGCVRSAMLFSHGLRRDVRVYLALGAGPRAPRVLRFRGTEVRFLRPDDRSLAILARKALSTTAGDDAPGFADGRRGVAVARGGLEVILPDLGDARRFVLEEGAPDLRAEPDLGRGDLAFFLGGPFGIEPDVRAALAVAGARPVSVGPVSLHAADVVALVTNEVERAASLASR